MQETLSRRCSTAWRQNEISCQSKVLLPLVHALLFIKTCSIEANTTLSLSVAQPVKIEFHVSLIFIDSIQYFIAKMASLQHISTKPNFPSWLTVCFQVLVVYFCMMYKFGYVPYRHKTWSQKFLHNTYLCIYIYVYIYVYIYIFLQLYNWYASKVRQTSTDVWSDSFSTLFNT